MLLFNKIIRMHFVKKQWKLIWGITDYFILLSVFRTGAVILKE